MINIKVSPRKPSRPELDRLEILLDTHKILIPAIRLEAVDRQAMPVVEIVPSIDVPDVNR